MYRGIDQNFMNTPVPDDGLLFRKPSAKDGYPLHELVAASPPLDPNSAYCNLLQCTHFADTAVAVLQEDRKSTRLNSSHVAVSYAVFCLKKKNIMKQYTYQHQNY